MNPELFIEAERVTDTISERKTAIENALDPISATFGRREVEWFSFSYMARTNK